MINPLSVSLHISETTGAIAEPALPAKLLNNTIVEYCEILDLISSDFLYVEPLINWTDGLIIESVDMWIESSLDEHSFTSLLMIKQSEFRLFFASFASFELTPPYPITHTGFFT